MNIAFVNIHDRNNLGDQVCCPADYFPEWKDSPRLSVFDDMPRDAHLIFGGGGMIFEQVMTGLSANSTDGVPGRKRIAWGIGHNQHGGVTRGYTDLADLDLAGIRDWPPPELPNFAYVPCSSCLHPAFDRHPSKPIFPFVVYEHHEYPIDLPWFARENNNHPKKDFPAILEFLSLGEKVITNTFHGAYWAMLLGKPVVIWKPFSTRFDGFIYPPERCDESNWWEVLAAAQPSPAGYLEECRMLNLKFHDRVMNLCRKS